MGYPIQFQEKAWETYESTFRCEQARLLMRPGETANDLFLGCLGRALAKSNGDIRLHFGGMTSNHGHLYLSSRTAEARAAFKRHLKTNVSKELGRIHDWKEGIFGRRSRDIYIADDALEDRLMYAASHGCKEGLVSTPRRWPGVQFVRAVCEGLELKGTWYDRTSLYKANRNYDRRKNKGYKPKLGDYAMRYTIELHPLPGQEDWTEAERRAWWCTLVDEAMERYPTKLPVIGVDAVLAAEPHDQPPNPKRSEAPFIHARDPATQKARRRAYRAYVEQMRAVLAGILRGEMTADDLPEGGIVPQWARRPATA